MSVNKVILLGSIKDKDIKLNTGAEGGKACTFFVVTHEFVGGKTLTQTHKVVAYGKTAEACANFLSKGARVHIFGMLQTRSWGEGEAKTYSTEVKINNITFLDAPFKKDPINEEG